MHENDVSQTFFQKLEVGFGGGPAGNKAAHGAMGIEWSPSREGDVLKECLHHVVGKDEELLIGGRVDEGLETLVCEYLLELHSQLVSMAGYVQIEVVGEERVELDANESSLGEECAVLLDDTEEMGICIAMCEYDRLTTKCADLGATDVEHIAMVR